MRIDLLFVGGPAMPAGAMIRYPTGPVLFPRLNAGGIVVVADTVREDETEAVERWRRQFPDLQTETLDCEKGFFDVSSGLEEVSEGAAIR